MKICINNSMVDVFNFVYFNSGGYIYPRVGLWPNFVKHLLS